MAASDRCRSYFKRRKRTAEEELQELTEQLTEQCENLSAKIKKASHFQFHRNPRTGQSVKGTGRGISRAGNGVLERL